MPYLTHGKNPDMFGSHLSIAGGMHHALLDAQRLGMDCVQIFTKNQRQWNVPPLLDEQIDTWRKAMTQTGITQVVSHDSYLINLASPKAETRDKSIALFVHELERCEKLKIPYLVTHPGAHMKAGEEEGLDRVAQALDQLHEELPDLSVLTCLEVTAGQGTALGYTFEHLATIIEKTHANHRLGVCLDTAHLIAAGYDLTSAAGAKEVIEQCDHILGLNRVKVLHINDSKIPRGKRVDRHTHIGHGHVSLDAFEIIVNTPAFQNIPKILETPKEDAPDGRPWDTINLETLRNLMH